MCPHDQIQAAHYSQKSCVRAISERSDWGCRSSSSPGLVGQEGILTSDAEFAASSVFLGSVHAGTQRFSPHEVTAVGFRNGQSARPSSAALLSCPGFAETRLLGGSQGPAAAQPFASRVVLWQRQGGWGARERGRVQGSPGRPSLRLPLCAGLDCIYLGSQGPPAGQGHFLYFSLSGSARGRWQPSTVFLQQVQKSQGHGTQGGRSCEGRSGKLTHASLAGEALLGRVVILVLPERYFFFSSVIFNLFVSLYLKRISRRQHVTGSCLYSPSDNLWFLIEAFSSLVFNVIIDNGALKSIVLLSVFYLCLPTLFFRCFFPTFFELMYYLVLHFISSIDFLASTLYFFVFCFF